MTNVKTAGESFRERRRALQLNQRQAADRIARVTGFEVSPQELSRVENGQTMYPSMESLVAMGTTYGMTPNEVAQLFGYWRPLAEPEDDQELRTLMFRLRQISPDTKQRVVYAIEMLLQAAAARDERLGEVERAGDGRREAINSGPLRERPTDPPPTATRRRKNH